MCRQIKLLTHRIEAKNEKMKGSNREEEDKNEKKHTHIKIVSNRIELNRNWWNRFVWLPTNYQYSLTLTPADI